MADNPYTTIGMLGMMTPNKYIDPAFQNKPLSLPGFYGAPTDALGNPIQSYVDAQKAHDDWTAANPAPAAPMTLNTNPVGPVRNPIDAQRIWQNQRNANLPMQQWGNNQQGNFAGVQDLFAGPAPAVPAAQSAAPAPAPSNPIDMRQAYLNALSNPGPVTTPGATVPQNQPLGQPSVLDAFLATHSAGPAAPAGGGYSNAGFFNTLNKLRSG